MRDKPRSGALVVQVAAIILRTGRAQSRRSSLPIFCQVERLSAFQASHIETTVLHEHRVQFRGSPYSPTTEPTLDLCANPAAIIGVLPLALIAARYWILHIFGKGAGRSSGLHTQSALLRGPEPRLPTTICWPQVGLDGFEPACLKLCFVIESVSRRAFS